MQTVANFSIDSHSPSPSVPHRHWPSPAMLATGHSASLHLRFALCNLNFGKWKDFLQPLSILGEKRVLQDFSYAPSCVE